MSTSKTDLPRRHSVLHLAGFFAVLLAGLLFVALDAATVLAQAGKPHFEMALTTDNPDTREEKDVFGPATPKVYVIYMVADLPAATKVRFVWLIEKAEGFQENSTISESSKTFGAGSFMGKVYYPKPAKGWPAGAYRVEMYIGERLDKTLKFRVTK
ncbi:hypothetical protein FBQ97_05535 [Acidobacteria bacterium ACD]|nr:MAG: hypothetical protein EDX89_02530 [Acidobacteriota bacterium]MCE7960117.1 hypothetical protein [Acidobacteria bacterium ACB2]MDL1949262.1 hypothetical protein [Acidobacteria bacterium ACD]